MRKLPLITLILAALACGQTGVKIVDGNSIEKPILVSGTLVLSNQQAVTGTAAALATNTIKTVCVKALAANTINVYLGPTGVTTSTGMELGANQSWCGNLTNTNQVFVVASTTGASVSWIATN